MNRKFKLSYFYTQRFKNKEIEAGLPRVPTGNLFKSYQNKQQWTSDN